MTITGNIHLLFEQSGTFKRAFTELGYHAEDYDIQNEFGETDHICDLFVEIDCAYHNAPSIFDNMHRNDLLMAFFPCIYFCNSSQLLCTLGGRNYRNMTLHERFDQIIDRTDNRHAYYLQLLKLYAIARLRRLRLIVENPAKPPHYLLYPMNFVAQPTFIDWNRRIRGDYYEKPTAYWFVNCKPTNGCTYASPDIVRTIQQSRKSRNAGICSCDRSMISPTYARNFICDNIIGKSQTMSQLSLF